VVSAGEYIGKKLSEQTNLRTTIPKRGAITTYFLFPSYAIRLWTSQLIVDRRGIDSYIVVGHSTNGQAVGINYKVGAPADSWTTIEENYADYPVTLDFRIDVAKWLNNESFTEPSYAEIGTGATVYDYTQTANVTPSGVRKIIETKDNSTSKEVEYDVRFIDRNDSNIREIALFNASSSGTMMIRYVISDLDLAISNEYRFSVTLNIRDVTPGDAMITNYGMNEIRDQIAGVGGSRPDYFEWSDGTGIMDYTDTSLDGSNKQRNAEKSMSDSRPTVPGYKVQWLGILTAAQLNSQAVTKSGLYTDSSGNTLFAQNQFGTINKTSLFKIQEQDSITVR